MELEVMINEGFKIVAFLFLLAIGIMWVVSARRDGNLTGDEVAKITIVASFVYMVIQNANRTTEWPVFGQGEFLIVLAAVLTLAGMNQIVEKILKKNGNSGKDS